MSALISAFRANISAKMTWLFRRPPVGPRRQCLERRGHAQHQAVRAAPAHQLQPQRQPIFRPAARDRYRRLTGEVERPGEGPTDLWIDLLPKDPVRPEGQLG